MFTLSLVTPEKKIVTNQELDEVTLPADKGELNILPGHAPLLTTLHAGVLSYKLKNGETGRYAISWGYCQVSGDGVSVLAENAMLASEIDTKTVQQHLAQNESKLLNETLDDQQYEKVQNEIARLQAELEITQNTKH